MPDWWTYTDIGDEEAQPVTVPRGRPSWASGSKTQAGQPTPGQPTAVRQGRPSWARGEAAPTTVARYGQPTSVRRGRPYWATQPGRRQPAEAAPAIDYYKGLPEEFRGQTIRARGPEEQYRPYEEPSRSWLEKAGGWLKRKGEFYAETPGELMALPTRAFRTGTEALEKVVFEPAGATVTGPQWREGWTRWLPRPPTSMEEIRQYRKKVPWWEKFAVESALVFGGPAVVTKAGGIPKLAGLAKGVPKVPEVARIPKAKILEIPRTEELAEVAFHPSARRAIVQKVAKVPGAKWAIERVKFSATAEDPISQARVLRGAMEDMAEVGTMGATARVKAIRPSIKTVGETVVDPRIRQIQNLPDGEKSMALHDIIEWSPRYAMPQEYRAFVNEIREVSKQAAANLRKEGIFVSKAGETDWQYLHRVVQSVKEDEVRFLAQEVEAAITSEVGVLPRLSRESSWAYLTRVSEAVARGELKPTALFEKRMDAVGKLVDVDRVRQRLDAKRYHELVAGGLRAGVRYADDPVYELQQQLNMSYRMIIDKRMGEFLAKGITTATKGELAAAEIGLEMSMTPAGRPIAASKALQMNRSRAKGFEALVNRAGRGEALPSGSMEAVEQWFPLSGTRLRVAVQTTKAKERRQLVQALLQTAKAEVRKAQGELAVFRRVSEKFPTPEMGQVIGVPGISGKIIPTQFINGKKVFGRDIATEIRQSFGWMPAGAAEKMVKQVGMVGGVMRMAKASLDLSVQLIQLVPVLGLDMFNLLAYPGRLGLKQAGLFRYAMKPTAIFPKAVAQELRAAFNKALVAEQRYWAKPENLWYLQEGAKRGALAQPSEYFEAYGPVMQKLGQIPVAGKGVQIGFRQTYGRAEAAFTAGRNIAGNEYRKAYWHMAEVDGKLEEMSRASNLLTGVLSTKGMGISAFQRNVESGMLFFSPRFTRAVTALFGHMFTNPTSWTGRQAIQAVTGLMAGSYLAFTEAALLLGQKPKLDPRPKSRGGHGAEWLTVKIGGRNIGLGGIESDMRAAVTVVSAAFDDPDDLLRFDMENPAFRRLRAKFSPPTAALYSYFSGRDYLGEPVRGGGLLPTKESVFMAGKWGLPIWVESMVDEGASLPGVLAEFFGGRQFPESIWTIYNNRLLELSGKKSLDDISDHDRAALERKYPELGEIKDAGRADMERRGYNERATEYWNLRSDFQTARVTKLEAAAKAYKQGQITGVQFKEIIQNTGRELGAQYRALQMSPRYSEVLEDLAKRDDTEFPEDAGYARYWDILLDPSFIDEMGVPRYREQDDALDALRREVGEEVWSKVQERVGWSREIYPFAVREYYQAVDLLRPYWELKDQLWAKYPKLKRLVDEVDRLKATGTVQGWQRAQYIRQMTPLIGQVERIIKRLREQWRRRNPAGNQAGVKYYGWSPL